jgi:hypothetical protein
MSSLNSIVYKITEKNRSLSPTEMSRLATGSVLAGIYCACMGLFFLGTVIVGNILTARYDAWTDPFYLAPIVFNFVFASMLFATSLLWVVYYMWLKAKISHLESDA